MLLKIALYVKIRCYYIKGNLSTRSQNLPKKHISLFCYAIMILSSLMLNKYLVYKYLMD